VEETDVWTGLDCGKFTNQSAKARTGLLISLVYLSQTVIDMNRQRESFQALYIAFIITGIDQLVTLNPGIRLISSRNVSFSFCI